MTRRRRAGWRPGRGTPAGGWRTPSCSASRLWAAVDLGLPIQFHIGFGDSDIRMSEVDPTLLTDWLHLHRVPVMLLHCWPWHRHASYLACIYPHVHLDVGLGPALRRAAPRRRGAGRGGRGRAVHPPAVLLGRLRRPRAVPARARSPTGWRSDALLRDRVDAGEWAAADAERVAHLVSHGNAERVYRLPGAVTEAADRSRPARGCAPPGWRRWTPNSPQRSRCGTASTPRPRSPATRPAPRRPSSRPSAPAPGCESAGTGRVLRVGPAGPGGRRPGGARRAPAGRGDGGPLRLGQRRHARLRPRRAPGRRRRAGPRRADPRGGGPEPAGGARRRPAAARGGRPDRCDGRRRRGRPRGPRRALRRRRARPAAGAGRARLVRPGLRQRRGRRGRGRRHRAGRAQRLPASDPRPGPGAVPDRPVAAGRRPVRGRPAPARRRVDGPALRLRARPTSSPTRRARPAPCGRCGRTTWRRCTPGSRRSSPGSPPRTAARAATWSGAASRRCATTRPTATCGRPVARDTRGADVALRVVRLRRLRHLRRRCCRSS